MIALRGPALDPRIYQEPYFRLWPSVCRMRDLETFVRSIFSSLSKVWWEAAARFQVPAVKGKEILRPASWKLPSTNESSSSKQVNSSFCWGKSNLDWTVSSLQWPLTEDTNQLVKPKQARCLLWVETWNCHSVPRPLQARSKRWAPSLLRDIQTSLSLSYS